MELKALCMLRLFIKFEISTNCAYNNFNEIKIIKTKSLPIFLITISIKLKLEKKSSKLSNS